VHAVDYLLKPVRPERLSEALHKVLKPNKTQWRALNREKDGKPKARTYISSRTRRGIVLVPVGDIYFFRAEHKYVTVRYKEGEVLIEDTLKELETEFAERFLRIHRNCLVAVEYLQALEKNSASQPCVRLRGLEDRLEVSRRHLPSVRQYMKND
jgi:two-component system response regulator AlgR